MKEEYHYIKEASKGDLQAFRILYDAHRTRVYNTALSYLQNVEDAEEVTQDVFVSFYKKCKDFRGDSKLSTWLYRVTINKSINKLDKRKRIPSADVNLSEGDKIEFHHPGILLERKEKASMLFRAIESLSEQQKTAFILSHVEGIPRKEVAEIMETSLKAVESLLSRGKANLRKKIIAMYPKENLK